MIPPILHTHWFHPHQPNSLNQRCAASWAEHLPNYARLHWTFGNVHPYSEWQERALQANPDPSTSIGYAYYLYAILYKYGGITLQNDIQLLRPLDRSHACFLGFQRSDIMLDCLNIAVMGCQPGHWLMRECMDRLEQMPYDAHPLEGGPTLVTQIMLKHGLSGLNVEQEIDGVHVYDKSAFYSWSWEEKEDWSKVQPHAFAVHFWEGSWKQK